jgi:hypothetical protein
MSFYEVSTNPANFNVFNPKNLVTSKLQLSESTIHVPVLPSTYSGTGSVTYSATDLLNGYIVREGLTDINVNDHFDTATNIIKLLVNRYRTITNTPAASTGPASIPQGTSFICKLFNNAEISLQSLNNNGITIWTQEGVIIGGDSYQITNGATAILEFIIQDQAALGEGHEDRVFVCISRCAAYISSTNDLD